MHAEKKDLFSDSYVTKYSCNDLQTSKNQYGKTDARKPKSKRRLREPGRSRAWKNTRCNSRRPLWCRTQRKKSTKSESRRRLRAGGRPGIAQKSRRRESQPGPDGLLSERLTSEPGRPGSEVKRSDKRPSGPGCDSLRLDFWAIPGRPPALSRRLDSLFVDFFRWVLHHSGLRELHLVFFQALDLPGSLSRLLLLGFLASVFPY